MQQFWAHFPANAIHMKQLTDGPEGMRHEISELHQKLKTTMIYVTHDQVEAMTMPDKIVVLHAGRIEQVGSIENFFWN